MSRVDGRRVLEEAARREAEAFRPNSRPILLALAVNGVLAALCLAIPYQRGQALAQRSLSAFAAFASCAIGGTPEPTLGLALPPAERSHFADKVLREPPRWPASCFGPLREVAPEQAIFLWPSVKAAGADVAAAASLVERELEALAEARGRGVTRVPERPLLAIGRLRAALTLLARAANVSDSLDAPAVRFTDRDAGGALEPSRLPIMAADTAALELWLRDRGLEAYALDGRGLSWLAVDDGRIDRTRVKRSALLRGTLRPPPSAAALEPTGATAFAVLATPPERCAGDPERCAHRATGVAPITRDGLLAADPRRPLSPQWLASHPAGRFDRAVRVDALHVELLAQSDEAGAIALRRFARATAPAASAAGAMGSEPAGERSEAATAEEGKREVASALAQWPISSTAGAALDALFVPDRGELDVAVARTTADGVAAELLDPRARGAALALGTVPGDTPFITACRDAQPDRALQRSFLAFGSGSRWSFVQVGREARGEPAGPEGAHDARALAVTTLAEGEHAAEHPIHATDPARDAVQVRCDGATSALLVLGRDGELRAVLCEDARCETRSLARGVDAFSAVLARGPGGTRLLAATSAKLDPSIAITAFRLGAEPEPPRVLAGCWEPAAGLCGAPTLAADGAHVVLAARERADLRALESRDAGASWGPLAGMAAETTTNLAAPMEQHRLRKVLEK